MRKRPCLIAYVGNSVTSQRDGYVPFLHAHFGRSTAQPHRALQVGLSGMGSMGCLFTLDKLVLNREPDICFIECTTGDAGGQSPLQTVAPVVEGLIRKLLSAGCACCILHGHRADRNDAEMQVLIDEYERVADHYGVPSIHLGRTFQRGLSSGEWLLNQLFIDDVHTTVEGGRLMAMMIARAFDTILGASGRSPELAGRLNRDNFDAARLLYAESKQAFAPDSCRVYDFRGLLPYLELQAGNGIVLTAAPADVAGILIVAGPHAGNIEVETDLDRREYSTWDVWCTRDLVRCMIFPQPIERGAKIRLAVTDRRGQVAAGQVDGANPKLLKLIGFMLYDRDSVSPAAPIRPPLS